MSDLEPIIKLLPEDSKEIIRQNINKLPEMKTQTEKYLDEVSKDLNNLINLKALNCSNCYKIDRVNHLINLEYLVTNSSAANGANSFVSSTTISGYSNITVTSVIKASGGSQKETVDQIKYAAPLNFLSQNRAVTKNDYIKLIQQKYPAFESVNVWGGEENDPPVYGKVFVSAKPRLGFEVTDTEKEYIKEQIIKPISIMTVSPEIVDVDYNYLKVESQIVYDPTKTALNENQLTTAILI